MAFSLTRAKLGESVRRVHHSVLNDAEENGMCVYLRYATALLFSSVSFGERGLLASASTVFTYFN